MNQELLVNDLEKFIENQKYLYASRKRNKLYIRLQAGPNIERYCVEAEGIITCFEKAKDAIKFFNKL